MGLLVEGPIDVAAVEAEVRTPAAGAVIVFVGTAREESRGRRVLKLFYEAYGTMAEERLAAIATAAVTRHGALRVAVRHRIGTCPAGETAMVVAVSAAHRPQAFEACRAVIEEIKASVPLWKKETYEDGSSWVGQGS